MIEVTIAGVRIEPETQKRFVILQDVNHVPLFSIQIAAPEAYAIAVALPDHSGNTPIPRPLTHDLCKNMLEGLGGKLVQVVVTKVVDEIFYAEIVLDVAGQQQSYDARPSDAFALAVRTQTPVFVEEDVLKQIGTATWS